MKNPALSITPSGEASLAISSDLITMSENAANNVIGSNAHEAPISSSENTKQYSLPTESHPTVHHGNIKAWGWKGLDLEGELNHANHIVSQIDQFHNIDPTKSKARIITITKPADNSLYSRTNTSAQRKAFLHALSSAQSYIRITNVNLNVPEVIDALVAATARGVRVEIVLPDGEMEMESAIDAKTNCQAYNELQTRIDALGKSEFLDLRWQTSSLGDLARKGKNHSKYMNADGVAFLGSTNLDIQSWKYSAELTVATTDVDAVRDLDQECFVNLFQRAVPFKNLFSVLRSNDD